METDRAIKEKSVNSFLWKTAESVCSLGMTFVVQLILARILAPEDFGIVGITTVIMTLANTVIETSFSSSVIQKASIDRNMLSSVFYANLALSVGIYLILFLIAPVAASFYGVAMLVPIIRVQGFRTLFAALYSIQNALMQRQMQYKKLFFCCLTGSVAQGAVGITMALYGAGVWALVISALVNHCVAGLMIIILTKWRPGRYFSLGSVRECVSFSFKVLAVRITRKLFYNIRSLTMGKVYDMETLGLFNKGFQFPSTAMTVVDGSLTSVAFTSLSKLQNDRERFLSSLRSYVQIMMYLCTPIMTGMLLAAKPMVLVLLTDKWAGCIPFLQIVCLTQLLVPLNVKTTAFEALGRSDVSMWLNVSGVALSVALIFITARFSAYVMVLSGLVSSIALQTAVTVTAKRMLNYSYKAQLSDMCSGLVPTLFMAAAVPAVNLLPLSNLAKLILDIIVGAAVFILCSYLTGNRSFSAVLDMAKNLLDGKKDSTGGNENRP